MQRLGRLTVEHLKYPDVYIEEPSFLVVLYRDGQEASIFGGHIITADEASEAILFRATQLLECSMVDPLLNTCTAHLVCEHGIVRFHFDPPTFSYVIE